MRELAKSMVGFSWAVWLFGVQQITKAMTPEAQPPDVTAAQLDDVAFAAQRHLAEPYAQQFRTGDLWQRRLIDVLFDAAAMRSFDPRSMASTLDPRAMMADVDPRQVIQNGVDLVQRSVNMVRQAATPNNAPSAG